MEENYDCLKLENQLCFPMYACSKEIVRRYNPFLEELNLTYTQYIVMMVLWEIQEINVKALGEKLYLDSGTLTPLLKKLESKNYITRQRNKDDERNLVVKITKIGMNLRKKAQNVPVEVSKCVCLEPKEAENLYKTLYKILNQFKEN